MAMTDKGSYPRPTGYGSRIYRIIFRTDASDAGKVQEALGLEPDHRDEDPEGAFFTWYLKSTRRGDDEHIVFMLDMQMPEGVKFRILWDESPYY